ncbi:MAG: hypothetical protein CME21_21505 [Gemmatimonadetes bacterium]|nr:hypothetical protein [Gemmatimonadota bacterium]|tara:strand:- start:185 stop:364 length:180 start_codon:yes stop_codon:yes gene_type:complete
MAKRNTKFPVSMATAEVQEVVWKKIHGEWVKVKLISAASSMNPISLSEKRYPRGDNKKS